MQGIRLLAVTVRFDANQMSVRHAVLHCAVNLQVFLSRRTSTATLQEKPVQFRRLVEAALIQHILPTAPELSARVMSPCPHSCPGLAQWQQKQGIQAVEGPSCQHRPCFQSRVCCQERRCTRMFDVDKVAFVNIPTECTGQKGFSIDVYDPDQTQGSNWMRELQRQVCSFLKAQLADQKDLEVVKPPRIGRNAITFTVSLKPWRKAGPGFHDLDFDLLLAPDLSAGAGAAAAAAFGVDTRSGTPAEVQVRAALAPVSQAADAAIRGGSSSSGGNGGSSGSSSSSSAVQQRVQPSYARNIWASEAASEFLQQAAMAAAIKGGIPERVVTGTIALLKAWIRKGLQQNPGKPQQGFNKLKGLMVELIVLHAVVQLAGKRHSQKHGGRYVLDLFLQALRVAAAWGERADASSAAGEQEPTLFTELAKEKFYSREQAAALQQRARQGDWPHAAEMFRVQPVVIHPVVDPLNNVLLRKRAAGSNCGQS